MRHSRRQPNPSARTFGSVVLPIAFMFIGEASQYLFDQILGNVIGLVAAWIELRRILAADYRRPPMAPTRPKERPVLPR
jgi:hypothetical protein